MAKLPVNRLLKKEWVWLATHRCKAHSVPYVAHYGCYLKEHESKLEKEGYLDIETTNLKASYGIMLCWCIYDRNNNKMYEGQITKEDLRDGTLDKRIVEELIKTLQEFDWIYTYYGCLTPGHRVLKSNLTWVPVEELKKGDQLLSFEEESGPQSRRKLQLSTVVHNIPVEREVYKIRLSNGETLVATGDHPWLVKRGGHWIWKKTTELMHPNARPRITRILPVWGCDPRSYAAGYVAAFFDGEGCISQAQRKGRPDKTFQITCSQADDTIIEKLCSCLDELGFTYSIRQYDKNHPHMKCLSILGGRSEKLRFLGVTQLAKLSRVDMDSVGTIQAYGEDIEIISIKSIGVRTVMGLGTTNGTYISEGFGSHNTKFDLPFCRTRAVELGLDFPVFQSIKHKDLYYLVRNKFSLHSNRLAVACEILLGESDKTRIDPKRWTAALQGNQEALDYILEHCRYDVTDLARLHAKVEDFAGRPGTSI